MKVAKNTKERERRAGGSRSGHLSLDCGRGLASARALCKAARTMRKDGDQVGRRSVVPSSVGCVPPFAKERTSDAGSRSGSFLKTERRRLLRCLRFVGEDHS